jgi:hypothetical protein
MSASGWWSIAALALGFLGAGLNSFAAWKWQKFGAGQARIALSDEDANSIGYLTLAGWILIVLGVICGAIGIALQ